MTIKKFDISGYTTNEHYCNNILNIVKNNFPPVITLRESSH
jgi:hypothetical protein